MNFPEYISVKRLFIATVLLKVFSSIASWLLHSPWLLGMIFPLFVMGVYVVLGIYKRDVDELSDEKFADSCYYLGFIFTITSIIVSLLDLPSMSGGGSLNEIAVRFGAAMISTVAGLIVRVYLVNFRKDIVDISKTLEDDILNAARDFRQHLQMSVDNLRSFNQTVDEAAKSVVSRLEISISETAKANTDEFSSLFVQVAEKIKNTTDDSVIGVKKSSDELQRAIQVYTVSLVGTAKHHEEKLGSFSESLASKLEVFSGEFIKSMDDLRERIDEFSIRLNGQLNTVNFPSELFKEELGAPVANLKESVGVISLKIEEISEVLETNTSVIKKSLNALPKSIADAGDKIREAVEKQRNAVDLVNAQEEAFLKLARNVVNLEAVLQRSAASLDRQNEAVSRLGDGVVQVAGDHRALVDFSERQLAVVENLTSRIGDVDRLLVELSAITRSLMSLKEPGVSDNTDKSMGFIPNEQPIDNGNASLINEAQVSNDVTVIRRPTV